MESDEAITEELKKFEDGENHEISSILDNYLHFIAKTGDPMLPWNLIKNFIKFKLQKVVDEFFDEFGLDESSKTPNTPPFNFDKAKAKILCHFDSYIGAPFTIQRLCEILLDPKRHYKRTDKFVRALEKNIFVVTCIEPGHTRKLKEKQKDSISNGVPEAEVVDMCESEQEHANGIENGLEDSSLTSSTTCLSPHSGSNLSASSPEVSLICSANSSSPIAGTSSPSSPLVRQRDSQDSSPTRSAKRPRFDDCEINYDEKFLPLELRDFLSNRVPLIKMCGMSNDVKFKDIRSLCKDSNVNFKMFENDSVNRSEENKDAEPLKSEKETNEENIDSDVSMTVEKEDASKDLKVDSSDDSSSIESKSESSIDRSQATTSEKQNLSHQPISIGEQQVREINSEATPICEIKSKNDLKEAKLVEDCIVEMNELEADSTSTQSHSQSTENIDLPSQKTKSTDLQSASENKCDLSESDKNSGMDAIDELPKESKANESSAVDDKVTLSKTSPIQSNEVHFSDASKVPENNQSIGHNSEMSDQQSLIDSEHKKLTTASSEKTNAETQEQNISTSGT